MGSLNLTIGPTASLRTRNLTIQDAAFAARILPAFKWAYGQVRDSVTGQMRDRTTNELLDQLFDNYVAMLVDIVRRYEVLQATTAAEAGVTDLSVT